MNWPDVASQPFQMESNLEKLACDRLSSYTRLYIYVLYVSIDAEYGEIIEELSQMAGCMPKHSVTSAIMNEILGNAIVEISLGRLFVH